MDLSFKLVSLIVLIVKNCSEYFLRFGLLLCSHGLLLAHFAVNPGGDLITNNSLLFVNTLCALAGYYCAAAVIDRPSVGRVKLQCISNMVCAVTFTVAGIVFYKASPGILMFLYFFSSYCVNFGPNVTTYVMAAETYPTELRGTLHGSES